MTDTAATNEAGPAQPLLLAAHICGPPKIVS